jgi:hypothetical protein
MNPYMQDNVPPPIVVNLGKKKKKQIKKLKKGRGPLIFKVYENVEVAKSRIGKEELKDKVLVPLIMIYKEKNKKRKKF